MSSMPWIKVYTDILDDTKIGRLSDNLKWRFIQLCVLAGECDAEGYFVNGEDPMTIGDIAWRLRLDSALLAEDLQTLKRTGLMEIDDDTWLIINFSKRQGRSQEEKRALWRERQQRKRERDKASDIQESHDDVTIESPVTHGSREEGEKEEEKRKRERKSAPRKRDARLDHPAIMAYRDEARLHIPINWREEVINTVDDAEKWRVLIHDWIGRGWNKQNISGMLQAYKNGGISQKSKDEPKSFPAIRRALEKLDGE